MDALANRLIAAFPKDVQQNIQTAGLEIELRRGHKLHSAHTTTSHLYFILSGLASCSVPYTGGTPVEVGTVGCDGVAGLTELMGPATAVCDSIVRIDATVLAVPRVLMAEAFASSREARQRLLEYWLHVAFATQQLAACNQLHSARERLARWLLLAAELTNAPLTLTQEIMAEALGVRRLTISGVLDGLRKEQCLEVGRSSVVIQDRQKLEGAACGCYGILRDLLMKLYAEPVRPPQC